MDLEELTNRLPDRKAIRRELERFADKLPSGRDVRERVSNLPAAAQSWMPRRHEPAWSDALTARNLAVFGVGMALGAGLAALLSPRSGPALRRDLIERVHRLRDQVDIGGDGASSTRGSRGDGHGPGARPDLSH